MSVCCPTCGAPAPAPLQPTRNSVQLKPGARPLSTLVRDPSTQVELTAYRETDVHTALARGLAEYIGQQSIEIGGRKLQLTTYTTWAEPEDQVRYPAAVVGGEAGVYDRGFTPSLQTTISKNVRLMATTEFAQDLMLEVWATDPKERAYLACMVEEALNPVDWMYGMRLILPFYHGAPATYQLMSSQYVDSSDDAMAKYRRAQFTIKGNVTAYRLLEFPDAYPRPRVDVIDSPVIPTSDS